MNKIILISLIILTLGCKPTFYQVYETNSSTAKKSNDMIISENDTLKISYYFWSEKGQMSFAIFNKTNRPIYIDWKLSSFIINENNFPYWIDETHVTTIQKSSAYSINSKLVESLTFYEGTSSSLSVVSKPERLTMIPPKSTIRKVQYVILPIGYYPIDVKTKPRIIKMNSESNKSTKVYSDNFSASESPISFRNYISYKFSETSDSLIRIDDDFYISGVQEMDYNNFKGPLLRYDKNKNPIYGRSSYFSAGSFYIILPKTKSVEYRKKL